jgi:hypothetical protein
VVLLSAAIAIMMLPVAAFVVSAARRPAGLGIKAVAARQMTAIAIANAGIVVSSAGGC